MRSPHLRKARGRDENSDNTDISALKCSYLCQAALSRGPGLFYVTYSRESKPPDWPEQRTCRQEYAGSSHREAYPLALRKSARVSPLDDRDSQADHSLRLVKSWLPALSADVEVRVRPNEPKHCRQRPHPANRHGHARPTATESLARSRNLPNHPTSPYLSRGAGFP